MEKVDYIKALSGNNPNFTDDVIEVQLETAKNMILNFCHIKDVPEELNSVQVQLALKLLNRMGQEGSLSYSEGGTSLSFDELLTKDIKAQLYAYRIPKGAV